VVVVAIVVVVVLVLVLRSSSRSSSSNSSCSSSRVHLTSVSGGRCQFSRDHRLEPSRDLPLDELPPARFLIASRQGDTLIVTGGPGRLLLRSRGSARGGGDSGTGRLPRAKIKRERGREGERGV